MNGLLDYNIVIINLKNAQNSYRMDICREKFESIQNGSIVIDKLFERIYFLPESVRNHEVQANITNNSYMIFPSVRKCLLNLNQQSRNIILVDNKRVYATDKTYSLAKIFQNVWNKYGTVFEFEYDAAKTCLVEKIQSKNEMKDIIGLKYTENFRSTPDCGNTGRERQRKDTSKRKRKSVPLHPRKIKQILDKKQYCPDTEMMFTITSSPIFRTHNTNPASLMDVVNINIDPYSLSEEQSSLGEIVADCEGPDHMLLLSFPMPHPSHQTHTRNCDAHNATVSINNTTQTGQLEEASNLGSIPPSIHDTQEQNEIREQSPRYPRYSTYDARIASYATFREFRNLNTEEMATTGLFYTGKADLVQCFQCGTEHQNWRPGQDPLLEHIRDSPDCQFLEKLLGVNTLSQYKAQIRSSGKISGREHLSSSYTNDGATGGNAVADLFHSDHIRNPQYQDVTTRLSTFTRWPSSVTQKPEELAQAGFYYTGLSDSVRCFVCDGGLKDWEQEDEPWIEHARWFPQCHFVQNVKGQDFVDLVRRMTDESDGEDDVEDSNFWRLPWLENIKELTQSDEASQLDTYAAQTVIQTGYSRSVVAFAIDVLISKGKKDYTAQDIMDVILEKEDKGEYLPTDSDSILPRVPPESFTSRSSANYDVEALQREIEYMKSIVKCIKCRRRQINTLFLPCTHHCLCQDCAEKCSLCPICYKIVKHKIKTLRYVRQR